MPAAQPVATPIDAAPVASASKTKKRSKGDTEVVFNTSKAHKSAHFDRAPGSFATCDRCSSRFTVTPYTVTSPSGGLVCFHCEKEQNLAGGLAEGAAPKARKPRAQKSKTEGQLVGTEKTRVIIPSLQTVCLRILGDKIDELQDTALADYVDSNQLDRLAAIVCRNRALSNDTVKLLLHVSRRELKLYDCTSLSCVRGALTCAELENAGFARIAHLAPNIEALDLQLCGRMDDQDLAILQDKLKYLRRLELYGPFNVTARAWAGFFDAYVSAERALDGFLLRQSPRFGQEALTKLVESFPLLTELRLADVRRAARPSDPSSLPS